ncbi:MAG TPA: hypothetical protein VE912_23940 [Bacteroidales bacterium]|nr:hypothetical protein [Bacteroidales bacterium]
MVFEQPSIYPAGIRIDEPITTLTGLMVSAVCFFAFVKLTKIPVHNKVHLFLRYYFLSMGVATAIGGIIGHAFLYALSFGWKLPGWITSMLSIMLVERAAIEYTRPLINRKLGKALKWINLLELATFMTITLSTLNFFFVELHTGYGIIGVVGSINLYIWYKRRTKGSKLFLVAVFFSGISGLIYMNEWGISKWLTHSDISHLLLVGGALFFYLGAKRILTDPVLQEAKNN